MLVLGLLSSLLVNFGFPEVAQANFRKHQREIWVHDTDSNSGAQVHLVERSDGIHVCIRAYQHSLRRPSVLGRMVYIEHLRTLALNETDKDIETFALTGDASRKLRQAADLHVAQVNRTLVLLEVEASEIGIEALKEGQLLRPADQTAEIRNLAIAFAHANCSIKAPGTIYAKVLASVSKWQPGSRERPFSHPAETNVRIRRP